MKKYIVLILLSASSMCLFAANIRTNEEWVNECTLEDLIEPEATPEEPEATPEEPAAPLPGSTQGMTELPRPAIPIDSEDNGTDDSEDEEFLNGDTILEAPRTHPRSPTHTAPRIGDEPTLLDAARNIEQALRNATDAREIVRLEGRLSNLNQQAARANDQRALNRIHSIQDSIRRANERSARINDASRYSRP